MTDYISREAALAAFGDIHPLDYNAQTYKHSIENLPAADVRPVVRGKWKLATYSGKFGSAKVKWYDQFLDGAFWYCDNCKERAAKKTNFCPNCGAKMDGGE